MPGWYWYASFVVEIMKLPACTLQGKLDGNLFGKSGPKNCLEIGFLGWS